MLEARVRGWLCICAALWIGCGSGSDGAGASGAAAGGGAGGNGGMAGAGGASGSGGMGGNGGVSGNGDAVTTTSLTTETALFALRACVCEDGTSIVPVGFPDPVCFSDLPGPLPALEQFSCIDAVLEGSIEAQAWASCRIDAATAGSECYQAIDACEDTMVAACRTAFFTDFFACVLPPEDAEAIEACVTPSAEGVIDLFNDAIATECACAPDPSACLDALSISVSARPCIIDAIEQGLASANPTVANGTSEALACLGEQYTRWDSCLGAADFCEPTGLEACNHRHGPSTTTCAFPNDPPEMVQSLLDGCM